MPPLVAMWCRNCRQDVPGIASPHDEGALLCARCGVRVAEREPAVVASAAAAAAIDDDLAIFDRPPSVDGDWEIDDDFRAVDYLLERVGPSKPDAAAVRCDAAADAVLAGWHTHLSQSPRLPLPRIEVSAPQARTAKGGVLALAWMLLSLGLMALVCGGVLLVWSLLTGRSDLWAMGIPLALAGQAAFLVGVVFQMDGLWQSNQKTSETLGALDESLGELRHATAMLGTTHSSGAASFYAHMAEGAPPEMMLADLKGQLDLLTLRLAQVRR